MPLSGFRAVRFLNTPVHITLLGKVFFGYCAQNTTAAFANSEFWWAKKHKCREKKSPKYLALPRGCQIITTTTSGENQ